MKRSILTLATAVFVLWLVSGLCAAAGFPVIQIKGTVRYIASQDTFGILSDNGKKYQPVKQLPKEFRKDGVEVVVDARERADIVASRMWGSAVEVLTIARADRYISYEDRQAIRLLLLRMDAFNAKDLGKLQAIDTMARSLTPDQFSAWLGSYGRFTLEYVETARVDDVTITGLCLYSRELQNAIALSGSTQRTFMQFTLKQSGSVWVFDSTQTYRIHEDIDQDAYIRELMAKTQQKYGTDNLAKWKG